MATMWKPDPVQIAERKLEAHRMLHREAGKRGWSTTPKMSSIDKIVLNEDGSYKHTVPNLKLGTGDTPLEAAADGYVQAMPDDLVIRQWAILARIEAVVPVIQRHAATMKKLDKALDDLTDLIGSVNQDVPAQAGETVKPQTDEDDDL